MTDSIFTKIIRGDIPSFKVYEDETTLAFLDINPVQFGHTLVIPKKQVEFIWDLDDQSYSKLMDSVKKVGCRLRELIDTSYVSVQVVGVDIPHAHVHLIPFNTVNELKADPNTSVDPNELKRLANKLFIR
jgi:histidine triad (HIT) family protein